MDTPDSPSKPETIDHAGSPPTAAGPVDNAGSPPQARRWQVGLRTVLILIVALAVWMAYFVSRRRIAALESRLAIIVPLAHELVVDDPGKIAVVRREERWYDEKSWEVYLPVACRLCIATRDIAPNGPAPAALSAALPAGRHVLALERKQASGGERIAVTCDGRNLLTVDEPGGWNPGSGSTSTSDFSESRQCPADLSVELVRLRFMEPRNAKNQVRPANGLANGILLWIRPPEAEKATR